MSDVDRRLIELSQDKWKIVFEERDRISRYVVLVNSGGILACITIAAALLSVDKSPFVTTVPLILFSVGLFFAGFAMFSAFASMQMNAVHFREGSKKVFRGNKTIEELVNDEIRATMWPPSEILMAFSFFFFITGLVVGLGNLYDPRFWCELLAFMIECEVPILESTCADFPVPDQPGADLRAG